jgi:hypothetical protein
MSHPCEHWRDGCRHREQPHGANPSRGVCRKFCQKYQGPDRGLGDTIARFTQVTGIAKVVEVVAKKAGKDCGCAGRRARLNAALAFGETGNKDEGDGK